ncbi:class I tRNA ligase family protein [Mycobacterium tuberculosis]
MPSILDTKGPDRRHRNAIRRHGPLRGTGRGAPSARGQGRVVEKATYLHSVGRRTRRRADRAAAIPAVVVRVESLAKAAEVWCATRRRDSPGQHGTRWFSWVDDMHDWCISRQLW